MTLKTKLSLVTLKDLPYHRYFSFLMLVSWQISKITASYNVMAFLFIAKLLWKELWPTLKIPFSWIFHHQHTLQQKLPRSKKYISVSFSWKGSSPSMFSFHTQTSNERIFAFQISVRWRQTHKTFPSHMFPFLLMFFQNNASSLKPLHVGMFIHALFIDVMHLFLLYVHICLCIYFSCFLSHFLSLFALAFVPPCWTNVNEPGLWPVGG